MGWHWHHFNVPFAALGSLWGHFGITLTSFWDPFAALVPLGSLWHHFGVTLGWRWHHFGVPLRLWDHPPGGYSDQLPTKPARPLAKGSKCVTVAKTSPGGWSNQPPTRAAGPLARCSKCVTVVKNKLLSISQHDDNVKMFIRFEPGAQQQKTQSGWSCFYKWKMQILMIDGCG